MALSYFGLPAGRQACLPKGGLRRVDSLTANQKAASIERERPYTLKNVQLFGIHVSVCDAGIGRQCGRRFFFALSVQ
jgi:hypothetical protein